MPVPVNVIANADDFGLNASVNAAIKMCFDRGTINSTSLLTNTPGFAEAVQLALQNPKIQNIGVHINLAEGKPLTTIDSDYLDGNGNWDVTKTGKLLRLLNANNKKSFATEIDAQIKTAINSKIKINHIDSHYHLHTLPAFYPLFLAAAKQYGLKLRLAQTYREGSYLKYAYRKFINNKMCNAGINHSVYFETVHKYLLNRRAHEGQLTEVMLHPDLDATGNVIDNYDSDAMTKWLAFLNQRP